MVLVADGGAESAGARHRRDHRQGGGSGVELGREVERNPGNDDRRGPAVQDVRGRHRHRHQDAADRPGRRGGLETGAHAGRKHGATGGLERAAHRDHRAREQDEHRPIDRRIQAREREDAADRREAPAASTSPPATTGTGAATTVAGITNLSHQRPRAGARSPRRRGRPRGPARGSGRRVAARTAAGVGRAWRSGRAQGRGMSCTKLGTW